MFGYFNYICNVLRVCCVNKHFIKGQTFFYSVCIGLYISRSRVKMYL